MPPLCCASLMCCLVCKLSSIRVFHPFSSVLTLWGPEWQQGRAEPFGMSAFAVLSLVSYATAQRTCCAVGMPAGLLRVSTSDVIPARLFRSGSQTSLLLRLLLYLPAVECPGVQDTW